MCLQNDVQNKILKKVGLTDMEVYVTYTSIL